MHASESLEYFTRGYMQKHMKQYRYPFRYLTGLVVKVSLATYSGICSSVAEAVKLLFQGQPRQSD